MSPLQDPFYGSEAALRVALEGHLSGLRMLIEATRGTVRGSITNALENGFDILESIEEELHNKGE